MNKQTLFVSLTAAVLLCACQSSKVKISGRIVGNDAKNVYLEQVSPLSQSVIDSAVLDKEGNYRFELKGVTRTPSLYNIIYNGERIPLFLAGGDRLSVNSVGSFIRNYTVEGSKETELLRQFYQAFVGGAQRLDNIAGQFARTNLSEEERKALVKEYTDEYYRIRREQLRFIIENKSSLAAVYALYQRLPGDTYLFNGDSDVVYYRTVAEALEQSYPDSPYLQSLLAEITRMDARISLTSRISEAGYPDLELSDIYGKKVRLSSLTGKVVLLDFWSAELGNSNTLNAELKEVYKKYADAEELNLPHVVEIQSVKYKEDQAGKVEVVKKMHDTSFRIACATPAVLSVNFGCNEPRLATLRSKRAAKSKPLVTYTNAELGFAAEEIGIKGSPTVTVDSFQPETKRSAKMLTGTPAELAKQLYDLIEEEKGK